MEKTKNYTKTVVVVEPNGASMPQLMMPIWDATEANIRNALRADVFAYGNLSEVQSVVECNARYLLTIMYRSGTVKIISYSAQ